MPQRPKRTLAPAPVAPKVRPWGQRALYMLAFLIWLAAGGCLVYAAFLTDVALGWAVAGVALFALAWSMVKALP